MTRTYLAMLKRVELASREAHRCDYVIKSEYLRDHGAGYLNTRTELACACGSRMTECRLIFPDHIRALAGIV